MVFDREWNDFFGYMVYNTPGTGLGPDSRTSYNDADDYEDEEDNDESNTNWWER